MKKGIGFTLFGMLLCLCLCACGNAAEEKDIWADAVYTEDTELGSGSKTVAVKVEAEERSVTFTISTDKETLGEALMEHDLVSGEEGAYGLYIKAVNGMTADYDKDQSYWSLCKNGEPMQTGADGIKIADGEQYELVYMK